jgi:hypothetical protein
LLSQVNQVVYADSALAGWEQFLPWALARLKKSKTRRGVRAITEPQKAYIKDLVGNSAELDVMDELALDALDIESAALILEILVGGGDPAPDFPEVFRYRTSLEMKAITDAEDVTAEDTRNEQGG